MLPYYNNHNIGLWVYILCTSFFFVIQMLVPIIILAVATTSRSLTLPLTETYDERSGVEQPTAEASRAKRNANVQGAAWGFLPIFAAPPVIQVHHIIHLQSPDRRCFPSPFPGQPPVPPTQSPVPPNNGKDKRRASTTGLQMSVVRYKASIEALQLRCVRRYIHHSNSV